MRWTWNPGKAAANRAKHKVSFETAVRVFEDPLHLSMPDPHPDGDRWVTLGEVAAVLLLVVHSFVEGESDKDDHGRIISARKATAHERKAYQEGVR
jgi:uncharacterized DUF497 family protein